MASGWRSILLPHHRLLQELVDFNDQIAAESGCDPESALDDIGLLFWEEPGGYPMTPRNVISFASTGGDGNHSSLLQLQDRPPDQFPVVLTVPMALHEDRRRYNHIVGADLREFLDLGCRYGYFAIEGVAFDHCHHETCQDLQQDHPLEDDWPEKRAILDRLRSRFQLQPWKDVKQRLGQLREEYWHLLEVDWSWLE